MHLPVAARVYVGAVIVLGAAIVAGLLPSLQFPHPSLFAGLFALSVISSALKVDLPVGVGSSCISLSYAVAFTSVLLLGPAPTVFIATASAWSQCTFRMKQRNPAYKTIFSMACLAVTVAATARVYTVLGGTYGQLASLRVCSKNQMLPGPPTSSQLCGDTELVICSITLSASASYSSSTAGSLSCA